MQQEWWGRCVGALALACTVGVTSTLAQPTAWVGTFGVEPADRGVRSLDLRTGQTSPIITLGASVTGLALSPDGRRLYAARFDNTAEDGVRVIDTATRQVVTNISVRSPIELTLSPDGQRLYVMAGIVRVVSTTTNTTVATIANTPDPRALVISPDGRWGYAPLGNTDRLAILDLQAQVVVTTLPMDDYPNSVAMSPDGRQVLVGHVTSPTVKIVDTATRTVVRTVPIPNGSSLRVVVPDATSAYVGGWDGRIHRIDMATGAVRLAVALPASGNHNAYQATVTSDRRHVLFSTYNGASVAILEAASGNLVRLVPVGRLASHIAVAAGAFVVPPEFTFDFEGLDGTAENAYESLDVPGRGLALSVRRGNGARVGIFPIGGGNSMPPWGGRSLSAECCRPDAVVLDFTREVNWISVQAGSFSSAAVPVRLEAFSGPGATGARLGEVSAQTTGGTFKWTTLRLDGTAPIRSARVFGGASPQAYAVYLDNVTVGWTDDDADGLPDLWERTFGLVVGASTAGDAGPDGDPDGDGLSNATEFERSTHPLGTSKAFLAEGATSSFFSTRLALLNPSTTPTTAVLTFLRGAGEPVAEVVPLPPQTRVTIDPATLPGMQTAEFSVGLETSQPVVFDRTMSWGGGYGAHAETAVAAPSRTWYLAEGSTVASFNLFYLLQNPNPTAVTVGIRYLRGVGAPLEKSYTLPARSRTTVWVNQEEFPGEGRALASADVSAVIQVVDQLPIIVERAMYMNLPGQTFGAGHESAGITSPATAWFLAEGATGPYFDLFVLIANPSATAAEVEATYLLPSGQTIVRRHLVPGNSRYNIWVDEDDPALRDTAVSTTIRVLNDVPVIVERSMWWPGSSATWYEAHNAPGARATAARWALAEGEVGGSDGRETYILVANTSEARADIRVRLLFEDGTSVEKTFAVAPRSRFNVDVRTEFPAAAERRFGALVESLGDAPAALVVERAMYWDAAGQRWAAGTNALATPVP